MTATKNFYSLTLNDLILLLQDCGKEKFRAEQLFRWVYVKDVTDFSLMDNMSKIFRDDLTTLLNFDLIKIKEVRKSIDRTQKILFETADGFSFETVLIPSPGRFTLCVSSEVGCNLGCKFCCTAKQKLIRRLSTDEIVGQYIQASRLLNEDETISNIVFMGMGEPLDNPNAVFKSVKILQTGNGLNLARKKITISTSGLVPQIPLVTDAGVLLAVSLNGTDDETRSKIMPVNSRWPINELMEACKLHTETTKEKVTIEYVLLKGITDTIDNARKLYELTKDIPCKINIIPFNEHSNINFSRPDDNTIDVFQNELIRLGVYSLRRKTMGSDICAACGQLNSI